MIIEARSALTQFRRAGLQIDASAAVIRLLALEQAKQAILADKAQ